MMMVAMVMMMIMWSSLVSLVIIFMTPIRNLTAYKQGATYIHTHIYMSIALNSLLPPHLSLREVLLSLILLWYWLVLEMGPRAPVCKASIPPLIVLKMQSLLHIGLLTCLTLHIYTPQNKESASSDTQALLTKPYSVSCSFTSCVCVKYLFPETGLTPQTTLCLLPMLFSALLKTAPESEDSPK